MQYPPCKNPQCASFGHPHPNCKCYSGGFAHGGAVCNEMQPHHESCEHFASGGQVEAQQEFTQNPDLAVDHVAVSQGLHHLLIKSGHTKSENPHKTAQDFLEASQRGRKESQSHSKAVFEKHDPVKPDAHRITELKNHLQHLQENPQKLLDIGGDLHSSLPDHAAALGAKTASVVNYFSALKPMASQAAPLDDVTPPSNLQSQHYDRQVALAEHPLHALQLAKEGRLQPEDLKTISTLYPKLHQSIMSGVMDSIVQAKIDKKEIPYKQKVGLSQLMGQPLDSTLSPASMMAIISSQGGSPAPQTAPKKGSRSGPTAQTQKTIKEADDMALTPLQARQVNRKS